MSADDVDTYLDPIDNTANPDGTAGAQVVVDANDLPEVLLANFELAPVSSDVLLGESGDDIIFGDALNTDHLTGIEGMGYPGLVNYLTDTLGHEPSEEEILEQLLPRNLAVQVFRDNAIERVSLMQESEERQIAATIASTPVVG